VKGERGAGERRKAGEWRAKGAGLADGGHRANAGLSGEHAHQGGGVGGVEGVKARMGEALHQVLRGVRLRESATSECALEYRGGRWALPHRRARADLGLGRGVEAALELACRARAP
jgi:hypothetical protein